MELFEHQKRAICRSSSFQSQLIIRSPGTGKTLIAITIVQRQLQENPKSNILWIGPANLEKQYINNFLNYLLPNHSIFLERSIESGHCNFCSFDMVRLNGEMLCSVNWDLIIVDEVHRAKNILTKTNKALWKLRNKTKRWYAFTGTPFQNNPYEFFEIVSLCIGHRVTVNCEACLQFRSPKHTPIRNFFRKLGFKLSRVNQGPVIGVKNPQRLKQILCNCVDYITPIKYHSECHLPFVKFNDVFVDMTENEEKQYRLCLRHYFHKKNFKNFYSDNLDDSKIDGYFSSLNCLRTITIKQSKVNATVELINRIIQNNQNAKILIFSNFIERGLQVLSEELRQRNINHLYYIGGMSLKDREKLIDSYLSGETQIMLLSPVGFEGLDLYGTTHVIILDPHYNPEKTTQLISRAVRAFSNVFQIEVFQLLSVSQKLKGKLIDEAIVSIANRKKDLAVMLEKILSM